MATRTFGTGVEVDWLVSVWKIDNVTCSLQVRMELYDERVARLRSKATEVDVTRVCFLSFDVLAASPVMEGQEIPDYPLFNSNVQVEEFARVVGDYSRRIDLIWNFVGELNVQGLERLAIWALRNSSEARTKLHHIGGICAAFVYEERELGHELIAELMSEWKELARLAPRDSVLAVHDKIREDLERLQEAVTRSSN